MLTEAHTSDELLERRRISAERRTRARARRVAAAGFACALLAFGLPFGAVEGCDGQEVRFTGAGLATFDVEEDGTYAYEHTLHEEVERNGSVLAIVTLGSAALGLALAVLGQRGARASAIVGLMTIQLLAWTIALAGESDGTHYLVGFWLALAGLLLALESFLVPERLARGDRGVVLVERTLMHALSVLWPLIVLAFL